MKGGGLRQTPGRQSQSQQNLKTYTVFISLSHQYTGTELVAALIIPWQALRPIAANILTTYRFYRFGDIVKTCFSRYYLTAALTYTSSANHDSIVLSEPWTQRKLMGALAGVIAIQTWSINLMMMNVLLKPIDLRLLLGSRYVQSLVWSALWNMVESPTRKDFCEEAETVFWRSSTLVWSILNHAFVQ